MEKKKIIQDLELPSSKKILFRILEIILPILILCILEFSLRIFNYGHNFNLFIDDPDSLFQNYKIVNPDFGAKYFHNFEYTRPKSDIFLKKKDPNCFRIIVMGSSTVVGFPYDSNLMFPRILQNRLQSTFPNKKIEVINTAITAINSYTLLDILDDILNEKPDAILIYAGHNEYYGAFGVGSNEGFGKNRLLIFAHLKLMNLRIYQLLRNTIDNISGLINKSKNEQKEGTLMSRIVKKSEIPYESDDYNSGIEQYKKNMSKILEKASKKNVPVFLSTLVSNIKDLKPFGSEKNNTKKNANLFYNEAIEKMNNGEFKTAKELFTRARDYDCVRFRASSDINKVIEEFASEYNATIVPMLTEFESNSPDSLIGNNLLCEHVHPNISGYFLMADVFYKSLINSCIITNGANETNVESATSFKKSYGYTELDSLLGYRMIENLKQYWPFKDYSNLKTEKPQRFIPKNMVDSLVFNIIFNKTVTPLEAHHFLAKKYDVQKDTLNTYKEYKAIIQLAPFSPELLVEAANYFVVARDIPLALKCYLKSNEYYPSYWAFLKAGEIYLLMNNYESAEQCFKQAYNLINSTNDTEILSKLFQVYIYWGKQEEAQHIIESIREKKPEFDAQLPPKNYVLSNIVPFELEQYINNASDLTNKKEYDKALKVLLNAAELNNSPAVNRMIGILYIQKHDYENALFYLNKSYNWFKYEPDFLIFMTQVNLYNNKFSEAQNCVEQLKRIAPSNPEIQSLESIISGRSVN
jgi:tetratricopeptide (TPR) repeat protein/lysophospholipase L1-like esterase